MRLVIGLLTVVIGTIATTNPASATDIDDVCRAPLDKDIIQYAEQEHRELDLLNIVDDKNYQEMKIAADASVGVPILKKVLSASANYDEFLQKRREIFQEYHFSETVSHSRDVSTKVTSNRAYSSFDSCVKDYFLTHAYGFYVYKQQESPAGVGIRVLFKPQGAQTTYHITSTVTGGVVAKAVPGTILPKEKRDISSNEELEIFVARAGEKDITVSVTVSPAFGTRTIRSELGSSTPATLSYSVAGQEKISVDHECAPSVLTPDQDHPAVGAITVIKWNVAAPRAVENVVTHCDMPTIIRQAINDPQVPDPLKKQLDQIFHNVCQFQNVESLISDGHNSQATIRSWTHPQEWWLCGDVYIIRGTNTNSQQPISLSKGTVTINVPAGAGNPTVSYHTAAGDMIVGLGKDSADGSMKFLQSVQSGTDVAYVYRFK